MLEEVYSMIVITLYIFYVELFGGGVNSGLTYLNNMCLLNCGIDTKLFLNSVLEMPKFFSTFISKA